MKSNKVSLLNLDGLLVNQELTGPRRLGLYFIDIAYDLKSRDVCHTGNY